MNGQKDNAHYECLSNTSEEYEYYEVKVLSELIEYQLGNGEMVTSSTSVTIATSIISAESMSSIDETTSISTTSSTALSARSDRIDVDLVGISNRLKLFANDNLTSITTTTTKSINTVNEQSNNALNLKSVETKSVGNAKRRMMTRDVNSTSRISGRVRRPPLRNNG